MRTVTVVTTIVLVASHAVSGQQPQAGSARSFDVASVKPSAGVAFAGAVSPNRFLRGNIALASLMAYAFDVPEFQIVGGPPWMRTARFDVDARATERPAPGEMRVMVRELLAERFKLRTHVETRHTRVFVLTVASRTGALGPKLRESRINCPELVAAPDYRPPTAPTAPGEPNCLLQFRTTADSVILTLQGAPIAQIVARLQPLAGRPIIDKTGLQGAYDLELEMEPPRGLGRNVPSDQPRRPELSVQAAVRDQLGLRLESQEGPSDFIVVDYVEQPTPN